jgi:hypothetical protein
MQYVPTLSPLRIIRPNSELSRSIWSIKSGSQMPTTLLTDPKLKFSEAPEDCSFNQAFGGHSLWEHLGMEENKAHRKTFDIAMATHAKFNPPEALAKGELVY